MPRKGTTTDRGPNLTAEMFLRSINLQLDADHPERIVHFQPTSKSVPLIRALTGEGGEGAYMVVAPYGSGKSITASYILQLVEGQPQAARTLEAVEARLETVSPELAEGLQVRRKRRKQGLTLAVHGYSPSVPAAIQAAAVASMRRQKLGREARSIERLDAEGMDDVVAMLDMLSEKAKETGRDRIVVLWDEFGRHLESLIAAGRAADLASIQVLAEYASRAKGVPVTLALLLHRDLLQYAGNLPQSVRSEWKKIEGRFRTIQYVDDSREIYRLIGEIVASRRSAERAPVKKIRAAAKRAKEVGLFAGLTQSELVDTLRAAYPLEPATLYLLPRLSARVAQNERTLFSFLLSADLGSTVGPAAIYDYFSGEMRSDVAAGGTYRQWLETESALSKVDDGTAAACLKTACLLSLGLGGERARTGREALVAALSGYAPPEEAEAVVDDLVGRKLLLHREHSDQVAVWHGTDVDLRGRLEEEKRRRTSSFDVVTFLESEVQAPVWRPLEYNDRYRLRRYLTGEYGSAEQIEQLLDRAKSDRVIPVGCDGRIVYGIVSESAALNELTEKVEANLQEPRLLVVLPKEPVNLSDAALEVRCLLALKNDRELVGSDPMVEAELHQMLDDARDHLQRLVDQLGLPSREGTRWFHQGQELQVRNKRELVQALSRIMEDVFPETPRLNNEMIVKERPSSVLINARKRLILGILEREQRENLGLEGNGPDASMMRTVLFQTGLFDPERKPPWARPEDLKDPGLGSVWGSLGEFLSAPSPKPKPFSAFFDRLREPPFGLRSGVLPILFAAGLKAFPSARALLRNGEYVDDLLASHVEAIFSRPEEHALVVRELGQAERLYLEEVYHCFTKADEGGGLGADLIRACFDGIEAWKASLPPGALTSKRVNGRAEAFQRLLRGVSDPLTVLFEGLPELVGESVSAPRQLLAGIRSLIEDLEAVEGAYRADAAGSLRDLLRLGRGEEEPLTEAGSAWARCFPDLFVESLPTGTAKALITRLQMGYPDEGKLMDSLASLLVGRGFNGWDDATALAFQRTLRNVVHEVEEMAISKESTFLGGGEATQAMVELIESRIEALVEQLAELVGREKAISMVSSRLNVEAERESA